MFVFFWIAGRLCAMILCHQRHRILDRSVAVYLPTLNNRHSGPCRKLRTKGIAQEVAAGLGFVNTPDADLLRRLGMGTPANLFGSSLKRTGFICTAGLEYHLTAVPLPREAKPRERARNHRFLKLRCLPGLPVIRRNFDLSDRTGSGPGQACDLIHSRFG